MGLTNSIILIFFILGSSMLISSERILFLFPLAFKSHVHVIQPLILGLAGRGHDITALTSAQFSSPPPSNVKEVVPITVDSVTKPIENFYELRENGRFALGSTMNTTFFLSLAKKVYDDPEFQQVIQQEYDLVIMNGFINEAFLGVVDKIGAPFILITTMPAPNYLTRYTGNHLPASFVPVPYWDFTSQMTFVERFMNFGIFHLMEWYYTAESYPPVEKLYREELGEERAGVDAILGNMSLLFMNSHFSINYPRPNLPDNIEVGGMHCRPSRPLPKDLEEFVSGEKNGFIYFSLGSIMKPSQMPEDCRRTFLAVFSKLKQRVLWKWDKEEMSDLPPNVKLNKWLPQQDILGHKNIKVFITHGGLLSTQEAVYHGVPLLGIPIFADQDSNMMKSTSQGFALTLEILNMTESDLEGKLRRLLDEPIFAKRAKELSRIARDQTETPLDRAIYWSEYVIRHKGALHLRSSARDLNYFQVHSYDVIGFLFAISVLALFIVKKFIVCVVCCLWRKKCNTNTKKTKSKQS